MVFKGGDLNKGRSEFKSENKETYLRLSECEMNGEMRYKGEGREEEQGDKGKENDKRDKKGRRKRAEWKEHLVSDI